MRADAPTFQPQLGSVPAPPRAVVQELGLPAFLPSVTSYNATMQPEGEHKYEPEVKRQLPPELSSRGSSLAEQWAHELGAEVCAELLQVAASLKAHGLEGGWLAPMQDLPSKAPAQRVGAVAQARRHLREQLGHGFDHPLYEVFRPLMKALHKACSRPPHRLQRQRRAARQQAWEASKASGKPWRHEWQASQAVGKMEWSSW